LADKARKHFPYLAAICVLVLAYVLAPKLITLDKQAAQSVQLLIGLLIVARLAISADPNSAATITTAIDMSGLLLASGKDVKP
jgi:hypothetical protein